MIKKATVLIIAMFITMLTFTSSASAEGSPFYWKDSYGRGVGTIPVLRCEEGTDRIGALCYKPCREGFDEAAGNRLACTGHTYLRGKGTAVPTWIKTEKKWGRTHRYLDRNHVVHWRHGWIYPKKLVTECRPGKDNYGGLCFNACRDGYRGDYEKCIYKTNPASYDRPVLPLRQYCKDGKTEQSGLCYKPCRSGTKGIGPVCWGETPHGYEACGAGFAKSKLICGTTIAGQTLAVGNMAAAICEASEVEICSAASDVEDAAIVAKDGKETEEAVSIGEKLEKSLDRFISAVEDIFKSGSSFGERMSSISRLMNLSEIKMALSGAQVGSISVQLAHIDKMDGVDQELALLRLAASVTNLYLSIQSVRFPQEYDNVETHMSQAVLGAIATYSYPVYGQRSRPSLAEVNAKIAQQKSMTDQELSLRNKMKREKAPKAILGMNQWLAQGQKIVSSNKKWEAILQTDGNFVVYKNGKTPVWASGTHGHNPAFLIMQSDGNLVVYKGTGPNDNKGPLWSSDTHGHNPAFLIMQNDGNLVMYKGTGSSDNKGFKIGRASCRERV